MKIKDLQQLIASGASVAVEFGPRIEDAEAYPEPGMRAVALSYRPQEHDVCVITFSYEPFESHNKALESSNYYDKQGNAVLTAREAGQYKPVDTVYFTPDDDMEGWFTLVDSAAFALFSEYRASTSADSGVTYTCWLEQQVLRARA